MALRYAAVGLVALAVLVFIFADADWRLPGRDATLILIVLAIGFFVLSAKIDAIRKR